MRFTFTSRDGLFTEPLKEYSAEKLGKPILRHRLDGDSVRLEVDAAQHREQTGVRVIFHRPGIQVTVSSIHPDAYAAIDLVTDKLERKLTHARDKRLASRRHGSLASMATEESETMTADEEEVLREMGALDEVLEV